MEHLNRTTPPVQRPFDELSLTAPQLHRLDNGIPVYTLYNEQLELIHLIVQLRTGVLYETQKHTANFAYSLLKESSQQHSPDELAALLDFHGAHVSVSVQFDKTTITISLPSRNVTAILPIIYDFLVHPQYRQDSLEIYKNLKIKDLEYNSQKTDVRSTQLLLHAVFGDEYTAGQFSTRDNLQAVTIEQMIDFHRRTFCAENLSLFITGHINETIGSCIRSLFEQVPHGVASNNIHDLVLPVDPRPLISEEMANSVQSSITICQVKEGYGAADRHGFSILSTILGGYFGSRLMQSLRERHGFTYGISAGSVYFGNQSLFIINSDVNAAVTQAALDACFEELQRLQDEPIGYEELDSAQNYIIGDMLRDVENSVSYLKKYAFWSFQGLDETEFQRYSNSVKNIDADTILHLAKKHLKHNKFKQIIVGDTHSLK